MSQPTSHKAELGHAIGEALQAVSEGRADYHLGSLLVAVDILGRKPLPGIEVRQLMNYGTGHCHFGIRKDWAPLAGILNKGIAALRGAELPQWRAAVATLPSRLKYETPMTLSVQETAELLVHPVLRVGAVRGLSLLNDVNARRVHSGIAAEYTEHVARRLGVVCGLSRSTTSAPCSTRCAKAASTWSRLPPRPRCANANSATRGRTWRCRS